MTTTPHPTIRPETAGDAAAIETATVAAFREAPHSDRTEQRIDRRYFRQARELA